MAKMFYTLDETKAALGKGEDEIKQYSREGRLREFRDGPRLMFKADQVDALRAQLGGGGGLETVDLGPSDSGAAIGLVDSRGGSGIGLADTGGVGSGLGSGVGSGLGSGGSGLAGIAGSGLGSGLGGGAGSGMMNLKEDTALAADLGLSGSVGGVPSPARGSASGTGLGGSAGGRSGINVFGDEPERADPMAQTAISSGVGSVADLNLEGIGSGSGLLDLTRESDDTSLGAELLDEISPGKRPTAPPDTGAMTAVGGSGVGLEAPRGGIIRGTAGVTYMEAPDPMGFALGGLALGAAAVLIVGILALVSALFGVKIDFLKMLSNQGIWIALAICAALPLLFFVFFYLAAPKAKR